ncbi:hypothetical protein QTG64_004251 [Vibrio vulnificus]|uniref:DUF6161 domain-containing protein n=1 Tax=Vibrio vulnificus TaxID=672 RepID=UPI002936B269|nr:hypothetical protein [Vibrio vulnificus]ELQ2466474.1 hypothetical protein [Vibrio vulnificus]
MLVKRIVINDISGSDFRFHSLSDLKSFLIHERNWWERQCGVVLKVNKAPHRYMESYQLLNSLIIKASELELSLKNTPGFKQTEITQIFVNRNVDRLGRQWLWSGHRCSSVFANVNTKYGRLYAEKFIQKSLYSVNDITDSEIDMLGVVYNIEAAGEFESKDSIVEMYYGLIKERLYESHLGELKRELKSDYEDGLSKLGEMSKDYAYQAEELASKYDSLMTDVKSRFEDKIRLSAPAKYWKVSARKYYRQGLMWSLILLLFSVFGMGLFYGLYISFTNIESDVLKFSYFQQIVLIVVLVAMYAFTIKTISKLVFSSFHLMRDAEERRKLTYLYLSLSHKNKMDQNSRDIVLQALFSRCDTGLLNGDGSPMMPGVYEIINSAIKVK